MASYARFALVALIALGLGGCGDTQARIGLRNAVEASQYIQDSAPDASVRAAAAAIEAQVTASADQMDLVLWGLWESRSRANVTKQDWAEAPQAALRRSNDHTRAIEAETAQMRAWSGSLMDSLGLAGGLTGSGIIGLLVAGALKYRKELVAAKDDLFTSVRYAKDVETAKTTEEVEAIKGKYRGQAGKHLKQALALRKDSSKVA